MKLNPYLNFGGNAEDALHFYETALEGEIVELKRYKDNPMPGTADFGEKILHARIKFGDDNLIMISDTMKKQMDNGSGDIQLAIGLSDEEKTHRVFDKLAEEGKVIMPLKKQFWGDIFGMLEDKFGMKWMLNCQAAQQTQSAKE